MDAILNNLTTVLNHVSRGFWDHVTAMFIQSSILIVLLFITDFLLRKRVKAVFRYCLWMLVFAKLVLPTSLAFPTGVGYWLGEWWPSQMPGQGPVVTAEQTPLIVLAEQPVAAHPVGPLPEVAAPNPVTTVPAERSELIPDKVETLHWQVWLFLIWAAGALVLSSLLIRRTNSVKRLLAESREADGRLKGLLDRCRVRLGLTRNVRLRLSSKMVSPAVCGLIRPTILLPRRAVVKLPENKLQLILIHELVHIKRWDVWLNLVQTVLQVIYFYNPLLWLANARVRRLREQAVDETVLVAFGKQADSYSDMLLDIAEMAFRRPNLSLRLVGVVESKKALGRRIQHIMRRPMPKSAKVGAVGLAAIVLMGAVLLPMAKAGKPAVLHVAADGSAAYTSIQKAIDAAPEGALVRIAPGMYQERLKINKPLRLEGAGWDKTTITAENAVADEFENMRRVAMQRAQEAKLAEEAKRMGSEFEAELGKRFASMQTVLVHDTEQVAICNLKLTSRGRQLEGGTLPVPVLEFRSARARMSGCVIAGNPGDGVHVKDGSDVEIRDSLVAGVWGTGIVVGQKGSKPCTVRILDSDLRNCHYAGIVVRPGNDSTSIQRCRISGAAWHGIRYDSASPTIVGNLVFGNARCGIYASGKTTATVRQNLFYGNEMTGISCWFQNQDIIEQNSFVENKRSGLEVLGASKPIVRKNIFYANPTGVSRGNIGSDSPFAESDGVVTLHENLFWHNERNLVRRRPSTAGGESTTEDISLDEQAHNVEGDPLFVIVEGRDFSLRSNSPARRSGVGAADLVGFDSPWPLQDEEIAIIPESDTRDWRQWKKQPAATVRATKADTSQQDKPTPAVKGKLQQMIDQARPGEVVLIPKGVYADPVDIRKSLTLKGQSRTDCVFEVTANRPAIFVDAKNEGEVSIENITVKWQLATSERCEYPAAVAVKDTTAKVGNCCFLPLGNFKRCPMAINSLGFSKLKIDTCRFEGFEFTVSFGPGTEGTIQDCLVMDSGHQGISLYSGTNASIIGNIVTGSKFHAVRSTGGTLHMKDNLIIENANRGVYLGNRSASGSIANNIILANGTGISGFAQSNVKIENNVIADSSYAGVGMRSSCSLLIRNNILKGNQRGLIMFKEGGNGGNKIDRNLFWQNETDTKNVDKPASSITADPLFVDAEQGDFSLRPGPALDNQQGLTNPRVFAVLWHKWKNRADKNQPFTGEAVSTKVGDGDKSSESSEIGRHTADKPGGTGYAWQGTDRYMPPDFEAFFPDDPDGSKELQSLWQSADKDRRPDA
jgi:parallel beta-helix repeat protein